jgi:hypothetical protein
LDKYSAFQITGGTDVQNYWHVASADQHRDKGLPKIPRSSCQEHFHGFFATYPAFAGFLAIRVWIGMDPKSMVRLQTPFRPLL